MTELRLTCSAFWVDVRLREINGRWIASADTPDGPSLGLGELALEAIEQALEPFKEMSASCSPASRSRGFSRGNGRPTACARGERAEAVCYV